MMMDGSIDLHQNTILILILRRSTGHIISGKVP